MSASWPLDWRKIEEAGLLALPARYQRRSSGAVWRASGARNMRNSSVTLLAPLVGSPEDFLNQIKTFCAEQAIAPVLRLPSVVAEDPASAGLENQLEACGWRAIKPSLVMVRRPEPVSVQRHVKGGRLEELSLEAWLAEQATARAEDPQSRQLFESLMRSAGPGLRTWAWHEGRAGAGRSSAVASAMLFDDGLMSGLMNFLVAPSERGRGVGRRFLEALLMRADRADKPVWLQVQADNLAAVALYQRAGFITLYRYAYWCPH